MHRLKKLYNRLFAGDRFIYLAGAFLQKLIPLLLLPFLSRKMTMASFGLAYLFFQIANLLTSTLISGCLTELKKNILLKGEDFNRAFSSFIILPFLLSLPILLVLLVFTKVVPIIELPLTMALLLPFAFVASSIFSTSATLYKLNKNARGFAINRITNATLEVVFIVLFFGLLGDKLLARFVSVILAFGLCGTLSVWIMIRKNFVFIPSITEANTLFKNGLKWSLVNGLLILVTIFDRFVLINYYGLDELGKYTAALQLASMLLLFENSSLVHWKVATIHQLQSGKLTRAKLVDSIKKECLLFGLVAFFTFLFIPLIFDFIFPKKYMQATIYLPYILLGYLFMGYFKIFSGIFMITGQAKSLTLLIIISLALLIGSFLLLNPFLHIVSIPLSSFIAFAFLFGGAVFLTIKNNLIDQLLQIKTPDSGVISAENDA